MNEEVFQEMQMDTEGKFGGLGIEITMEEGFVKVIAPIEAVSYTHLTLPTIYSV